MIKNKKQAIKSKSFMNDNKKRLGIFLFGFAVVGTALLIRSFASTIVLSVNYATSFSSKDTNLSVITKSGAPAQVVSEPDGKKTVNYLQTSGDGLSYSYKLQPGFYQACFNVKPTTAGAKAELRSVLIGSTTAEPITRTISENGGTDYNLNSFKETCVNTISRDLNQALGSIFTPTAGTWRLSTLTVKTLDQDTEQIDLANAFQSKDPRFTFTGASIYYDATRGKNVVKFAPYGGVTLKVTELKRPLVNAQVSIRAAGNDSVLGIGIRYNLKGGEQQIPVSPIPANGNTNDILTTSKYSIITYTGGLVDQSNVSPSNPTNYTLTANSGSLYVDQLYFYTANYTSN